MVSLKKTSFVAVYLTELRPQKSFLLMTAIYIATYASKSFADILKSIKSVYVLYVQHCERSKLR